MNCKVNLEDSEELVVIERLAAGQAFHKTVQSAFLAGLAGGSGFRERHWRLVRGGRGRVDLAVEVDGDKPMLVVIEIKGTNWDAIPADRVMRNLRRHLRQLQAYLDTAMEDMDTGRWDSVVAALLYPARPASAGVLATIEATAGQQAVQVAWYDDVTWRL
jgi:hypothetical protein